MTKMKARELLMRLELTRFCARATMLASCALGLFCVAISANAQNEVPVPLTLPQAIDIALKQNRSLKLAQLSVEDAQHKKEIARSAYFPKIRNESAVLHITELAGVQIPAGAFGNSLATGPIPGKNLFLDQGALTSYTSGTGLEQPLTQMLKIRESNRAAKADIATAETQVHEAEDDIVLKVRQLYYQVLIVGLNQQAAAEELNASEIKAQESETDVERGRALEVAAIETHAALLDARQKVLSQKLQLRDLILELNDALGLPLATQLRLDGGSLSSASPLPGREECLSIARRESPEIRAAQASVTKAQAGLAAAKDEYIPNITALSRYSYQSGIPLLVHNFGTFGASFNYELFDGGKRHAQVRESQTLLSQAELNLVKMQEEVAVAVEIDYDRVAQLQEMVGVAEEVVKMRKEAARLTDRQLEQNATLASVRAEAQAKWKSAQASYLNSTLALSLAEGELMKTIGDIPR